MPNFFKRAQIRGAALAVAMTMAVQPAWAEQRTSGYLLGAGDTLQITVFGQSELSGKFRVRADGAVSLPLVGDVKVANLTTADVARDLESLLAERLRSPSAPSVEVAEYAPLFVTGDSEKPGQYAFRPGMIVLELIALSGGARRSATLPETRMLQVIAAEQDLAQQRLARYAGEVQRARIKAELAGTPFSQTVEGAPGALIRATDAERVMANERALYDVRKTVVTRQQAALKAQRAAYDGEISALKQSIALHNDEIDLLAQDVDAAERLVKKGLAPLPRLLTAKRELSATRRDALDLRSYLARAQQNQLQTEQKIQDVTDEQAKENAIALRELDVALAGVDRKLSAAMAIVDESRALVDRAPEARSIRASYTIARPQADGSYADQAADEFTALAPRDILRIKMAPAPDPLAITSTSRSTP